MNDHEYDEEEYEEKEEEHEWVDWKRQDDAQRYRDIKSTQDSFKSIY